MLAMRCNHAHSRRDILVLLPIRIKTRLNFVRNSFPKGKPTAGIACLRSVGLGGRRALSNFVEKELSVFACPLRPHSAVWRVA